MKTKIIIALILLVMLNACTLAGEKPMPSDQDEQYFEQENTFVGVYFAPYDHENSFDETIPFDINNNELTFFIFEQVEENGAPSSRSHGSGNFIDSHVDVSVTDESQITKFKSKIPIITDDYFTVAVFSIFKDENDKYIVERNSGYQTMSGMNMSVTMSNELKTNIDGEEYTKSLAIDVEFVWYDLLKEVRVLTVDEDFNILDEQFVDEQSEFTLDNALHSIIVEEIRVDAEGKEYKDVAFYSYKKLSESIETQHTIVSDTEDDYAFGKVYAITLRVSP